jgi:hypothetical protein
VKDGRDVIVVSNEIAPNTFDHPTAEEINALPDKFRQYILDLETCCDKSGDGQTIAMLREDREGIAAPCRGARGPGESADPFQRD